MEYLHANLSASVSEFKKNPDVLLEQVDDETIVILDDNKPVAYLISVEAYEQMLEANDDCDLMELVIERLKEKDKAVPLKK